MWSYDTSDDKRECPVRGRNCHPPTFESYRQMLAHCRQQHPDRLPFGGDYTTELVITDPQGKILSWEEMRQIIDDPSFWQDPQEMRRVVEEAAMRGPEDVAAPIGMPIFFTSSTGGEA